MLKSLSGAVLRDGGSGQFITLPGAQPALGPSPSTGTGFTLVTDAVGITTYSSSLGFIRFTSGTLYSYIPGQNISVITTGTGTFQIYAPTVFQNTVQFNNSLTFTDLTASGFVRFTTSTNATSTTTGALTVTGGVGIGQDLYVGGTIYGNISTSTLTQISQQAFKTQIINTGTASVYYMPLSDVVAGSTTLDTTSTFTFNVQAGILTSPQLTLTSTATSTSTITGALLVAGGVGISGNLNATKVYDSGSRVISSITVGAGVGINGINTGTFTGPNVVLTNTGVLSILPGTGTNVSSTTGNVTVWITPPTLQYVTQQGNATTTTVFFNNLTPATGTTTASVVVAGGVTIAQNLIVGTNINATTGTFYTIQATNSASYASITTLTQNSIYTPGGIGVGSDLTVARNTIIYGNLTVLGTQTIVTSQTVDVGRKVVALSTSAGPAILAIDSGITVGPVNTPFVKFLFDGVSSWKSTGNILPSATRTYNLGSPGYQWNNVYTNNEYVYGQGLFLSTATSTDPTSGALIVTGGVGIVGDENLNGNLNVGGITALNNTTSATNIYSGALQVAGGVGIQGNLYVRQAFDSNGNPFLTAAALANYGVSKLLAGTDTAVSSSSGIVTVWNVSTLQSVTDRGATTNNPISITNTNNAVNSSTGALTVAGGVGIAKDLYVGGNAVVYGSVTFTGAATNVYTTNTVFTDAILELHKPSTGTEWTFNDAQDIGIRMHYFYNTGTNAWFGRKNGSGYLEWFQTAYETAGLITGTYGTFKTGAIIAAYTTSSNSTTTGALIVAGGAGIGGALYVGGDIFSRGSAVLTAANLQQYGVSSITGASGTNVSTSTGNIVIWSTASLQTVTNIGNSTTNAVVITNLTPTVDTASGALVVAGGVGIGGSLNVFDTINTNILNANNANITTLGITNLNATGYIQTIDNEAYPVRILSNANNTSSFYVNNINSGTNAYSGFTAQGNAGQFVTLAVGSSNFQNLIYGNTGTAALYISPQIPVFDIGDSSEIQIHTRGTGPLTVPTMVLGNTGSVTVNGDLYLTSSPYDTNPSTTLSIDTNAASGFSDIRLSNSSFGGQSYTLEVGGNNRDGMGGVGPHEGNFTLYDNIAEAFRLVVAKNTGNILINRTVDDEYNNLQVQGNAVVTDNFTANTATFLDLYSTGTAQLNVLDVLSTATFEAGLLSKSTSTFNKTVIIGSSNIETSVISINTTDPVSIDSFDSTLYRSCRSVVQVTDGDFFALTEIILLHDNQGQVYKSEYGIINTGNPLGEFTTDLTGGQLVLYFTAYDVSTPLSVNVVRTTISI